jgi:ribosome-binding factor A
MSRHQKLAALLKKEIADLLRIRINDSRIGFITLTEIDISKDYAHAWVYYSIIGSEEDQYTTKKGLQSATPFLHRELCKRLTHQNIPKLHFKYDDSLEKGFNIIQKMKELDT